MKPMFKSISEQIEPDEISCNKIGNVTTYTHIIKRLTVYTDFDCKKLEIREKINEFTEKDIEDRIQEDLDESFGEITKHNHYIYRKITHIDKDGISNELIDKENPLEKWFETEENVHLPVESKLEICGEEQITTFYKYDQIKKTDRYNNITYGPKVLLETWVTKESTEDVEPRQIDSADCKTIEKLKRKKYTDRYGNITYGEPYVVSSEVFVIRRETIIRECSDDDDCKIF